MLGLAKLPPSLIVTVLTPVFICFFPCTGLFTEILIVSVFKVLYFNYESVTCAGCIEFILHSILFLFFLVFILFPHFMSHKTGQWWNEVLRLSSFGWLQVNLSRNREKKEAVSQGWKKLRLFSSSPYLCWNFQEEEISKYSLEKS